MGRENVEQRESIRAGTARSHVMNARPHKINIINYQARDPRNRSRISVSGETSGVYVTTLSAPGVPESARAHTDTADKG
jgi:hypothetical protein